jgi:hypothetical protein
MNRLVLNLIGVCLLLLTSPAMAKIPYCGSTGNYVAVAGNRGGFGSMSSSSRSLATNQAMYSCTKYQPSCQLASLLNGCIAYAWDQRYQKNAFGYGCSRQDAIGYARVECKGNCELVEIRCSWE